MIPLRIMLVDDHPLIREAIGHLIAEAPDFELVGEAADGKECLARVEELRPEQFVRAMSKAGVKGYVLKSASGRELITALRAVAGGKHYLSPEVTGAVMALWDESPAGGGEARTGNLGKREKQVLKLIAEGQRSAAIAKRMSITVATVDAHRRNILRKLQLHSAADLTRYAIRQGLISP
jgi:DNA-binding NarL/FixJ family response regulator